MIAVLRRSVQVVAFLFAAFGHYFVDIAPPDDPSALVGLASMLTLSFLILVSVALRKPSKRRRRIWLATAVVLTVFGGALGVSYQLTLRATTFIYTGDHSRHVAGSVLTPAAQRLVQEKPFLSTNDKLLLSAQGDEEKIWSADSLQRAHFWLISEYLGWWLSAWPTAIFAGAELLDRAPGERRDASNKAKMLEGSGDRGAEVSPRDET